MKPRVSVIMSIYKEPIEWIRLAVDSILNQTYKDFEFIIVCDNPDYSEGRVLVNEYANQDSRVVIIINDENIGLTKSLNKAIAISQGQYIARMDADDISLLERFQKQIELLENNLEISVCYTNTDIIDEKGIVIRKNNYSGMSDISYMFVDNPIAHSTVMFKRELINLRMPLYNELYRNSQDYELWSFLLINDIKFMYLDSVCLQYRKSANQISQKNKMQQYDNSKVAHTKLITDYLSIKAQKDLSLSSKQDLLSIAENIYRGQSIKDNNLLMIIYMIYLSFAKETILYSIKFLLNRNLYVLKMPKALCKKVIFAKLYGQRINYSVKI